MKVLILIGLLAVVGCTSFSRKAPTAEQRQDQADRDRWLEELQAGKLSLSEYQSLVDAQQAVDRIRGARP